MEEVDGDQTSASFDIVAEKLKRSLKELKREWKSSRLLRGLYGSRDIRRRIRVCACIYLGTVMENVENV